MVLAKAEIPAKVNPDRPDVRRTVDLVNTPAAAPPAAARTRAEGSLAGVVSLAAGLGVAQLVAGLWRDGKNPVVAVGEWVVDHVPPGVKDWAIRTFGTNDKLVLIIGTLVVLGFVAAWLGRLARRRLAPALVGIAAIGVLGALASLDRPNSGVASVLPAVIGSVAAAAALAWLSGWRPGAARAEGAEPTSAGRRRGPRPPRLPRLGIGHRRRRGGGRRARPGVATTVRGGRGAGGAGPPRPRGPRLGARWRRT